MPDIFKHDDYAQPRERILSAYVGQMVAHLQMQHPGAEPAALEAFVKRVVLQRLQRPQAMVLAHPQYGVTEERTVDLLDHINGFAGNIITPSCSVYLPPSKKVSPLRRSLEKKVAERKQYKHDMLEAEARGDAINAAIYNFLQASAKIFNNSVPGAMGSPHNCLYDLPGYNAITSTSRHSVMCGYAHVERLVEGNMYLTSLADVINYCVVLHRQRPVELSRVVAKYHLHIPSVDDLYEYFHASLRYYTRGFETALRAYLSTLHSLDRIFIYYALCLKNLVRRNDALFRGWFTAFFRTDLAPDPAVDPKVIFKTEKDLLAMVTALNYECIHREQLDDAIAQHPDGVRQLIAIARHMEAQLQAIGDLLTTFFRVDIDTPKVMTHPNMIRKTVLVSDTDSVIFTTQSMVEWYAGAPVFSRAAYEINAFTVYLISRTLEHVFARVSVGFGHEGKDIYKIAMKNEFLYPILMRTPVKKHYAGRIEIQEGRLLPKPKRDIKGGQFRGSALCAKTNARTEEFILWLLDTMVAKNAIEAAECLEFVARHELEVYTSVQAGEREFLALAAIQAKANYADPMRSDYFYHVFWEEVFADAYGPFVLPNKGLEVPLLGGGKALKDPRFLAHLEAHDPKLHARLLAFFAKYPDKKLSRIIFPPTLPVIPELFRPIIDVRSIICRNGAPFYLVLRCLGIGVNYSKDDYLVGDFYTLQGLDIPFGQHASGLGATNDDAPDPDTTMPDNALARAVLDAVLSELSEAA